MKKLLTIILIFLYTYCSGQVGYQRDLDHIFNNSVAYKSYADSSGDYIIKYRFNGRMAMVPATYPPGEPHYHASIEVYKLVDCKCFKLKTDTIPIGNTMQGYYVPKGCFEDVPAYWVIAAKKINP